MNKLKLIAREPTEEMLNAQYIDAGVGRDLARRCFMQMFDAAPHIESEAEKRALKLLKEYEEQGTDMDFEEVEIIRALLEERK